jgi:hypothetical protein
MRGDEASVSLVIVESGGIWPRFAQELRRRANHAVVESQSACESTDQFADRVAQRLYKLTSRGFMIEFAVIAANDCHDPRALASRQRLARAIAAAMPRNGSGELILSAAEHASDTERHHLFTLAGALMDELAGSAIGVRVRFTSSSSSAIRALRTASSSSPEITAETA